MTDLGHNNKAASQKSCNMNESVQHRKSIYLVPRKCYVWHYLKINS